jgi:hypothetical protein
MTDVGAAILTVFQPLQNCAGVTLSFDHAQLQLDVSRFLLGGYFGVRGLAPDFLRFSIRHKY